MEVNIVIPIYQKVLSALEKRSLDQAYRILGSYPITIIKPEYLNIDDILADYPGVTTHSFDDAYFSGIAGYNRLMLSLEFYEKFLNYEYILVHQLDAYVFRDELHDWCSKGFDYIGAPWLQKPVYRLPLISSYMKLSGKISAWRGKPKKQTLWNRVGNGGLSLRKVRSHYDAIIQMKEQLDLYIGYPRVHHYNEDVFWATKVDWFSYPDVAQALSFSFDQYPGLCYELNGRRLPFGCHSWYKRKMKRFWSPIIGF